VQSLGQYFIRITRDVIMQQWMLYTSLWDMEIALQERSLCLVDTRDKLVWDDFAILLPVLPILLCAPLKVSRATMDEYDKEEDAVEVGNRRGRSYDETPRQ
jgi:hypothetical protein